MIDLPEKPGRPAKVSLWTMACRAQGWNKGDRAKRITVLSAAVGRPIESANEIDAHDDFDAVKRRLLTLSDNIDGAHEEIEPEMGRARRLRVAINELMRCIAVYSDHPGVAMGMAGAQAFVSKIIQDKFNRGSRVTVVTLEDLTAIPIILQNGRQIPSQLDQLVYTLGACLNGSGKMHGAKRSRLGFRVAAGDSIHDMKLKAGLPCDCTDCINHRQRKEPDPY